jgi:hypothetical protein
MSTAVRTRDGFGHTSCSNPLAHLQRVGLLFVATPLGAVGGAAAALFGLALGFVALRSGASGRWRRTALAGIAMGSLALAVFGVLAAYVLLTD